MKYENWRKLAAECKDVLCTIQRKAGYQYVPGPRKRTFKVPCAVKRKCLTAFFLCDKLIRVLSKKTCHVQRQRKIICLIKLQKPVCYLIFTASCLQRNSNR